MSASTPLAAGRHIASILLFRFLFAIALPLIFELAFHSPQPHQVPIAVVGSASQAETMSMELHAVNSGGFRVEQVRGGGRAGLAGAFPRAPATGMWLPRISRPRHRTQSSMSPKRPRRSALLTSRECSRNSRSTPGRHHHSWPTLCPCFPATAATRFSSSSSRCHHGRQSQRAAQQASAVDYALFLSQVLVNCCSAQPQY
jgi:hypothetical protein